jgi:hypothetical protein
LLKSAKLFFWFDIRHSIFSLLFLP